MSKGKEGFLLAVQKGSLVPADNYTAERLRAKGYRMGDVLRATLSKPRNPRFHRLAHAFGKLCAENIERFEGMDAHKVLKTIQYEADIACERMTVKLPGLGMVEVRQTESLSFESMDEGRFREVYAAMCNHVSKVYWPELTPEQVAEMAETMPEAA